LNISNHKELAFQIHSVGLKTELSMPLKIKEVVDHVGLSLLLVVYKVLDKSKLEFYNFYQLNKLHHVLINNS